MARRLGHRIDDVQIGLYAGVANDGMSGASLWAAFLRANKNYYILPNEIALIERTAKRSSDAFAKFDTVIEFGPGSRRAVRRKTLPIIHAATGATLYAPVDMAIDYLNGACSMVETQSKLRTEPFQKNFFDDEFDLPGNNRLALLFGVTISNAEMREGDPLPRADIVQKLRHMGGLLRGSGDSLMLTSYDANADQASIELAYEDENWKRFVANLAYTIAGIVARGSDFTPSAWRHEAIWDEEVNVLHHCIVAESSQSFEIHGHSFAIRKGERFVAINCCKFPVEWFCEVANDAGFTSGEPLFDQERRLVIQPLYI